MADKRALALPTGPKPSSHHSLDPTGAPKSLKLDVPFQEHPWKSPGPKDWVDEHAGMISVLSMLTVEAFNESGKEAADGWGGTSTEAVGEEKGADIDASRMRGLRGGTGLSDGKVDRQSEEDRTEGVPLLHSPSAGNGLQRSRYRSR